MLVWTVNDIPDQNGRVVVSTGGNSGLGDVSSKRAFAEHFDIVDSERLGDSQRWLYMMTARPEKCT